MGGLIYHVINRGVGRMRLFESDADYAAFERVMGQAQVRLPMRLLGYCLMPNHWHLVVWPCEDGDLSEWMRWLTVTHTQRWHAHRHSSGTGPVYQGRFKSFPIQADEHLLTVLRYVERNAARAEDLCDPGQAEQWRWGNRRQKLEDVPTLCDWPVQRPRNWRQWVNQPQTPEELEALRRSVIRGQPMGDIEWTKQITTALGLESTYRDRGRPRKLDKPKQ
jgi:putative transposase